MENNTHGGAWENWDDPPTPSKTKLKPMIGREFGFLTVIADTVSGPHGRQYLCRCKCGKEVTVYGCSLRGAPGRRTRSCGCGRAELRAQGRRERKEAA